MVLLATTPAVHRDNAADGHAERADGVHKESLVSRSDKHGQVAENRLVQPIFQQGRIFAASITSAQYRAPTPSPPRTFLTLDRTLAGERVA